MNKTEFISRVNATLRENKIKKPVSIKKTVFHITDDTGNSADFTIKQRNKKVIFTVEDVAYIVEACLAVIIDALRRGEEITFRGFGTLGLHKRAPRKVKQPGTETWCDVEERYVPKFTFGNDLRMAARVYEMGLKDAENAPKLPDPFYDEDE